MSERPGGSPAEQEPWLRRLFEEKLEIDARLSRLTQFVGSQQFAALPVADRTLLLRQRVAMNDYRDVLAERVRLAARSSKGSQP